MPSFDTIYAWSKDWQYLLAGLLTFVAACIFAIGSVTAARIRAGSSRGKTVHRDLRKTAGKASGDQKLVTPQVLASIDSAARHSAMSSSTALLGQDIFGSLDQLRWVIRNGLSPQLSSDVSHPRLVDCCQRIELMQLQDVSLPENTPEGAQAQRMILLQDANALRELTETRAASSEIISALIKLNASARELAASLSDNTSNQSNFASSSG